MTVIPSSPPPPPPTTKGCVICLSCSGRHRSLGVHKSVVRSLTMDGWSEEQLSMLESGGGNTALRDFLGAQGVAADAEFFERYSSPAAELWRRRLAALRRGAEPPAALDPAEHAAILAASASEAEALKQLHARKPKTKWTGDSEHSACEQCGQKFTVTRVGLGCLGCFQILHIGKGEGNVQDLVVVG